MDIDFEKLRSCPHCQAKLNSFFKGNFRGSYFNERFGAMRDKYFCTKECYDNYKSQYIVEVYNGQPIYCTEANEEKRYLPYFEAHYYFTTIDDCRKRMDAKHIAMRPGWL
jgi:hypothetical protein